MIKNLMFSALLILCGCATGSHIITGNARPAISPDAVKIYSEAPANFEKIGFISANTGGTGQRATDRALKELKNQAGKIGANGIVLGALSTPVTPVMVGFVMTQAENTTFSATAIFVP